jgi:tRNA threonylcarbamoyladenosine biosynthesis protein TsaE
MNIPSTYTVHSTRELAKLAETLADAEIKYKLWAFYGEMGAGKTTFIRAISECLRVKENVSSPTFSLLNEYYSEKLNEPIYHFDFYRIESEKEAIDIGCEEYFESDYLCMVEWPEKILNLLPHPHLKISITVQDQIRTITFSYE